MKERINMKKYSISRYTEELKPATVSWTAKEIGDRALRFCNRTLEHTFDTLDEARKAFEALTPSSYKRQGCGSSFILVEGYELDEDEYDEDGEFVQGEYIDAKFAPYIDYDSMTYDFARYCVETALKEKRTDEDYKRFVSGALSSWLSGRDFSIDDVYADELIKASVEEWEWYWTNENAEEDE